MAYYDPNYYDQNPYEYPGYDQTVPISPPEPSKDWLDIPKINRTYVRKLHKDIIKEDFSHLNTEQLYVIEAMVEYIDLNEEIEIKKNSKDEIDNEIVTSLQILNLPSSELYLSKDGRSRGTRTTDKSATSLPNDYPPMAEFFQVMLSCCAKVVDESKEELSEGEGDELADTEEGGGPEGIVKERKVTIQDLNHEQIAEGSRKGARINVMEGNSALLLMTGFSMIQNFQKFDVRVAVDRNDVRNDVIVDEEGQASETSPFGVAAVRFPQSFHQAVLQQGAGKRSFFLPLVGYYGNNVGHVGLTVTLVCLGQGVEVGMTEEPRFYSKVKFLKAFPSKADECNFDPVVHPRLAVTLMNMEPPLSLCRTSSEIIQKCLESQIVPSEGSLSSNYQPRKCRWLDIAKELSLRTSKFSLNDDRATLCSLDMSTSRKISDSPHSLRCPRTEVDPELDILWRKLKRQCAGNWEEVGDMKNKNNALYDELEELLKQDKGESWEGKISTEPSTTSGEEERMSKSSRRSGRKST